MIGSLFVGLLVKSGLKINYSATDNFTCSVTQLLSYLILWLKCSFLNLVVFQFSVRTHRLLQNRFVMLLSSNKWNRNYIHF